jgi:DNA modification methylase
LKPYFSEDGIVIYHGDCREILPSLHFSVLITDPPYEDGYTEFLARMASGAIAAGVFGYPEQLVRWCVDNRLFPAEWVTWFPTNKFEARSKLLPKNSEHVACFGGIRGAKQVLRKRSKGSRTCQNIQRGRKYANLAYAQLGDVWQDPAPGMAFNYHERLHPNEKPLGVMAKLVVLLSEQTEIVADAFMGSGTTLLAAKQKGRKALGIEIEEKYCEIAAKRLSQKVLQFDPSA